jgi:hypothetical protein
MEIVGQYAELMERKRQLDAELRDVKAELEIVEGQVEEYLVGEGMQSVKLASGQVVYLTKNIFASAKEGDKLALVEGLEAAGFKDLVTVNHNTFKSFCKEQIDMYKAAHPEAATLPIEELVIALPEQLREHVQLGEKTSVRMRKA